jgi:Flp pilus assembly protein TadD
MATMPLSGSELAAAEKSLSSSPGDALTAMQLADAYTARGDFAKAEKAARTSALAAPRAIDVQLRWVQAAQRAERPESIIDACRAALALQPNLYRVHYQLGQALEQNGDRTGALNEYRAALLIAPKYSAALRAQMRLQLEH